MHPLIAEAAKKAAVAWLTVPGAGPTYLVWCLWADDSLYLVSGEGEQAAPGLVEAATGSGPVTVTMSGDHGGRVVSWSAAVTTVVPGSDEWTAVVPQLAGKRLNSVGGAEQTVERWAAGCAVHRLTPTGDPSEAGASLPDGNLVSVPRPSEATRHPRKPFRLHKVPGAGRGR